MARLDLERQQKLEPERMATAVSKIEKLGFIITHKDTTKIKFHFGGSQVTFFPYSGWHTGQTIQDGRGLFKLLKQLKIPK